MAFEDEFEVIGTLEGDRIKVEPQQVFNYLVEEKGVPEFHAKGMVSNIKAESNFNIDIEEIGQPSEKAGLGLFQYTEPTRKRNFLQNVPDWKTNWKRQIDFALTENLSKEFLSKEFESPEEASEWFTKKWERPADTLKEAERRKKDVHIAGFDLESAGFVPVEDPEQLKQFSDLSQTQPSPPLGETRQLQQGPGQGTGPIPQMPETQGQPPQPPSPGETLTQPPGQGAIPQAPEQQGAPAAPPQAQSLEQTPPASPSPEEVQKVKDTMLARKFEQAKKENPLLTPEEYADELVPEANRKLFGSEALARNVGQLSSLSQSIMAPVARRLRGETEEEYLGRRIRTAMQNVKQAHAVEQAKENFKAGKDLSPEEEGLLSEGMQKALENTVEKPGLVSKLKVTAQETRDGIAQIKEALAENPKEFLKEAGITIVEELPSLLITDKGFRTVLRAANKIRTTAKVAKGAKKAEAKLGERGGKKFAGIAAEKQKIQTTKEALTVQPGKLLKEELAGEIPAFVAVDLSRTAATGAEYKPVDALAAAAGALVLSPGVAMVRYGLGKMGGRISAADFDKASGVVTQVAGMEKHPGIKKLLPRFVEIAENPVAKDVRITLDTGGKSRYWTREELDKVGYEHLEPDYYESAGNFNKTTKGIELHRTAGPETLAEEFTHFLQDKIASQPKHKELNDLISEWETKVRDEAAKTGVKLPQGEELFAQTWISHMGHADKVDESIRRLVIPDEIINKFKPLYKGDVEAEFIFDKVEPDVQGPLNPLKDFEMRLRRDSGLSETDPLKPSHREALGLLKDEVVPGIIKVGAVKKTVEALNKSGRDYSFVYADGRNITGINDAFGHVKGDDHIRAIWGDIFQKEIEKLGGILGRDQGDELTAVIPDKSYVEAEVIMKGIYDKIESQIKKRGLVKLKNKKSGLPESGALGIDYGVVEGGRPFRELAFDGDQIMKKAKKQYQRAIADRNGYIWSEGLNRYVPPPTARSKPGTHGKSGRVSRAKKLGLGKDKLGDGGKGGPGPLDKGQGPGDIGAAGTAGGDLRGKGPPPPHKPEKGKTAPGDQTGKKPPKDEGDPQQNLFQLKRASQRERESRITEIGAATASTLRRGFLSRGNLPPDVFEAKITKDAWYNSQQRKVTHNTRRLKAATKKAYGRFTTPRRSDVQKIDLALKGEYDIQKLPKELWKPVKDIRDHVDDLSGKMIDDGVVEGDLAVTIDQNMGTYLKRSYQVFHDPKWAKTVSEDVRNKAKSWLRKEFPDKPEEEIHGLIESLLMKGQEGPIATLKEGKLGSKDLSIFKRRKDIPIELRELWGEIKDPYVNYAISVNSMARTISGHNFLTEVKAKGLGKYFFQDPIVKGGQSYKVKISSENNKTLEPLNGLYTTPEIAQAFTDHLDPRSSGFYMRTYMKANGTVKFAKTVGSLQTHIRNVIGNLGFAVANGHWRAWKAGKAFKTVAADLGALDSAKWQKKYREYVELGVVYESPNAGELFDTIKDATKSDVEGFYGNWAARKGKQALKGLTNLYRAEDDIWKVFAFENELARYRKALPDMGEAKLKKHVAEIVRNTYPTYSLVPKAVKWFRRVPFFGTFVSFPAEVARVGYNILSLTAKELKDPKLRAIGAQRLAGITAATAGPASVAIYSRYITGTTKEEEDDMRRFLAPWSRNSILIHLGKDEEGNRGYIDVSYTDPWSYLKKPVIALMNGDDWESKLLEAAREAGGPFFGEEILAGKLVEVYKNKKKTGAPVFNEHEHPMDQQVDKAKHIWDAFEPGTVTSLERIWRGHYDRENEFRKYDFEKEVTALFSGHRIQELSPEGNLHYKSRGFLRNYHGKSQTFKRLMKSTAKVSEAEARKEYNKLISSRKKLFNEYKEDIDAAKRLTNNSPKIEKSVFSDIPRYLFDAVQAGQLPPVRIRQEDIPPNKRGLYNKIISGR